MDRNQKRKMDYVVFYEWPCFVVHEWFLIFKKTFLFLLIKLLKKVFGSSIHVYAARATLYQLRLSKLSIAICVRVSACHSLNPICIFK